MPRTGIGGRNRRLVHTLGGQMNSRNGKNHSRERCTAHRHDGSLCRGFALDGTPHCFAHSTSPEVTAQVAAGRRAGGVASQLKRSRPPLAGMEFSTPQDIVDAHVQLLRELRDDRVDKEKYKLLLLGLDKLTSVRDMADVRRRLDALEDDDAG